MLKIELTVKTLGNFYKYLLKMIELDSYLLILVYIKIITYACTMQFEGTLFKKLNIN